MNMEYNILEYKVKPRFVLLGYTVLAIGLSIYTYFVFFELKTRLLGRYYDYPTIFYIVQVLTIAAFIFITWMYYTTGKGMFEFMLLTHEKRTQTGSDTLILFIFLYPYAIYKKFKILTDHLKKDHKYEKKFPPFAPITLISAIPLPIFIWGGFQLDLILEEPFIKIFALIFLAIFQLIMFLEINWTNVYNQHIQNHYDALDQEN